MPKYVVNNIARQFRLALAEEYKAGATIRELAAKHSVSIGVVYRLLLRSNVTMRSHGRRYKVEGKRAKELVRLYRDEGWSCKKLCKKFGVSYLTLSRTLRRHGVMIPKNTKCSYVPTEAERARILEMHNAQYSIKRIARAMGVADFHIERVFDQLGLLLRGTQLPLARLSSAEKQYCVEAYLHQGLSIRDVARAMHRAVYVVRMALVDAGVEIAHAKYKRRQEVK